MEDSKPNTQRNLLNIEKVMFRTDEHGLVVGHEQQDGKYVVKVECQYGGVSVDPAANYRVIYYNIGTTVIFFDWEEFNGLEDSSGKFDVWSSKRYGVDCWSDDHQSDSGDLRIYSTDSSTCDGFQFKATSRTKQKSMKKEGDVPFVFLVVLCLRVVYT